MQNYLPCLLGLSTRGTAKVIVRVDGTCLTSSRFRAMNLGQILRHEATSSANLKNPAAVDLSEPAGWRRQVLGLPTLSEEVQHRAQQRSTFINTILSKTSQVTRLGKLGDLDTVLISVEGYS